MKLDKQSWTKEIIRQLIDRNRGIDDPLFSHICGCVKAGKLLAYYYHWTTWRRHQYPDQTQDPQNWYSWTNPKTIYLVTGLTLHEQRGAREILLGKKPQNKLAGQSIVDEVIVGEEKILWFQVDVEVVLEMMDFELNRQIQEPPPYPQISPQWPGMEAVLEARARGLKVVPEPLDHKRRVMRKSHNPQSTGLCEKRGTRYAKNAEPSEAGLCEKRGTGNTKIAEPYARPIDSESQTLNPDSDSTTQPTTTAGNESQNVRQTAVVGLMTASGIWLEQAESIALTQPEKLIGEWLEALPFLRSDEASNPPAFVAAALKRGRPVPEYLKRRLEAHHKTVVEDAARRSQLEEVSRRESRLAFLEARLQDYRASLTSVELEALSRRAQERFEEKDPRGYAFHSHPSRRGGNMWRKFLTTYENEILAEGFPVEETDEGGV